MTLQLTYEADHSLSLPPIPLTLQVGNMHPSYDLLSLPPLGKPITYYCKVITFTPVDGRRPTSIESAIFIV